MDFLEIKQGQQVFEYGSTGELFYFILEGTVEITILDSNK